MGRADFETIVVQLGAHTDEWTQAIGRAAGQLMHLDKPLPEALLNQRTVGQLVDLLAHTELETHDKT